jgi:hypothetical protein
VYVPYQLERLLLFGVLLCFDSFLVPSQPAAVVIRGRAQVAVGM